MKACNALFEVCIPDRGCCVYLFPFESTIFFRIQLGFCIWSHSFQLAGLQVELEATTEDEGTTLKAPTNEAGLAPLCKDTFYGNLRLEIWERTPTGRRGKVKQH